MKYIFVCFIVLSTTSLPNISTYEVSFGPRVGPFDTTPNDEPDDNTNEGG